MIALYYDYHSKDFMTYLADYRRFSFDDPEARRIFWILRGSEL
jgi:hypothetical protein